MTDQLTTPRTEQQTYLELAYEIRAKYDLSREPEKAAELIQKFTEQKAIELQMGMELQKLSLQQGDIVIIKVPAKTSIVATHRIREALAKIIHSNYNGLRIPLLFIEGEARIDKADEDRLSYYGLQRIPEERPGTINDTRKRLKYRYINDPRYEEMEFSDYLIEYIHNNGR